MTKQIRQQALERQVARLDRRLIELDQINNHFVWFRLLFFVSGLALSGLFYFLGYPVVFGVGLLLTFAAFAVIVVFHRRIERSLLKNSLWRGFQLAQLARSRLDWAGIPACSPQPERPLELDLDLTGSHSLHQLLSTAASSGGQQRLRDWLANPEPDPLQSRQRQQIVRELVPLALFRGRLLLQARLASRADFAWETDRLVNWLAGHRLAASLRPWLILLGGLAVLNVLLLLLNLTGVIGPIWQITLVIYLALSLLQSRLVGEPFAEAAHVRDALEQLVAVFARLEQRSYRSTPHLAALCRPFLDTEHRPSQYLRRINRLVAATAIRGNPFFWLALNIVFPWDYFFAYRLDRAKVDLANYLPGWLDSWFEIEALSSLANLAYLNPEYSFPTITADPSGTADPVFRARQLGHPLIPDQVRVCNDFTIDHLGTIALFTGSNMSGKSTFLRTVATNLVLAYAGGPVVAASLETIPFRLASCIRISDSVTDGISYFYAEVQCLKSLLARLEQDHPRPVIYFIDEIFRGTNNRERLLGSRAYIRALAGRTGVGLISTHDLELVHLADEIPAVRNYHFRDDVRDGRMYFDYTLHHGPSPTTNALKIMRLEGLPV
jgi:hypothetical protein